MTLYVQYPFHGGFGLSVWPSESRVIYVYSYVYILSQKRCKIGPNIKMNGLSYSHESKQKVCGTTFPVNHLYVCYRRHIHTLLCRTLSPTRRLISFLVYFLVCERCRTFYLYGSMWLFSSRETKKIEKKSGWRRSSRRQTFFLFEFVSQQHND